MPAVLVTYGSSGGQTAKVASVLRAALVDGGHRVTVRRVDDTDDLDLAAFDGVLVGAPVYNRRQPREVRDWVRANRSVLASRPSGFFQLSFASAVPGDGGQSGARRYADGLVSRTGWRPDRVGLFAGAVEYRRYGPVTQTLFRLAAAVTTGDTDTRRSYEYTDWDDVAAFADEFGRLVDAETATPGGDDDSLRRTLAAGTLALLAWATYRAVARRGQRAGRSAPSRPERVKTR